jgi:hypothetical protein
VTLVEIRDNPKAPTSVRVMCANAILDRAMGRPAQRIEPVVKIASSDPVGDVERLEAEIRQLSKNTFPASARRTKPAAMADKDGSPQAGREMREPVRNSSVTGDSRERPALFNRRHPEWRRPHQKPVQAVLAQSRLVCVYCAPATFSIGAWASPYSTSKMRVWRIARIRSLSVNDSRPRLTDCETNNRTTAHKRRIRRLNLSKANKRPL